MAAKKKTKKKQTRVKKSAGKKMKPAKKLARRGTTAKKKVAVAKKKAVKKSVAANSISPRKKAVAAKRAGSSRKPVRRASPADNIVTFTREKSRAASGGQSGDLQGLSSIERANSQSVDELLEEGNAFEAEAVAGVEHAGDADEEEVHTHEVSEDDVPGEYLEKN